MTEKQERVYLRPVDLRLGLVSECGRSPPAV